MLRALFLGLTTTVSVTAVADTTQRITLERAITLAQRGNPALADASLAVIEADGSELRARGVFDASLEAATTIGRDRHDPRQSPLTQQVAADQVRGSLAIRKRFTTGTEAAVTLSATRGATTQRFAANGLPNDLATTTVSPQIDIELTQSLWGGRRAAALRVTAATSARNAADHGRRAAAAAVTRDIIRAYYELAFSEREVAIRSATATATAEQLRIVTLEIERGARPRQAAAEIEEEVARRREETLIATGAMSERSLELARLLGLPPTTVLRADSLPELAQPTAPAVSERAIESVTASDPRVAAALERTVALARELAAVDDETRWQIDAFVRGTIGADADRVRDALAATAGYRGWAVEAGLTVRAPLASHTRRGGLDAARARLVRARIEVAETQSRVAREAHQEVARIAIADQRQAALARSIELAEHNLAAEQRRWDRGDSTAFELLRRHTLVGEARLRATRAVVDRLIAAASLASLGDAGGGTR